jgi:hypothetical protein
VKQGLAGEKELIASSKSRDLRKREEAEVWSTKIEDVLDFDVGGGFLMICVALPDDQNDQPKINFVPLTSNFWA